MRARSATGFPPPAKTRAIPPRRLSRFALLLLALGSAAVAGGLVLLWRQPASQPPAASTAIPDRPLLVVNDDGAKNLPPKNQALNSVMCDTIETGLATFDDFVVIDGPRKGKRSSNLSYSLLIDSGGEDSGGEDSGKRWFSFKLRHDPSGDLVWSRAFSDVEATNATVKQLGNFVVRAVGDAYGAINIDAINRSKSEMENPHGYFCELAAFGSLGDPRPDTRAKARDCLERESAESPADARPLSLLAASLVRGVLDATADSRGPEDLRRASQLASQAFDRAPQRARPVYATFLTRFYDKRYDDAFVAAQKALELNPNSSIVTAQIGAAYISRGQYARGEALLAGTAKMEQAPRASWRPIWRFPPIWATTKPKSWIIAMPPARKAARSAC